MLPPGDARTDDVPADDDASARRPRVVILVDNDVRRDSRVQKQARSMAEHGWDVRVLGLAPRGETARWEIGGAQVRLLKVTTHRRPYEARSPRWRNPLAFGSQERERQQQLAADRRRADVTLRLARARNAALAKDRALHRAQPVSQLPRRALAKALGDLVGLRSRATESVRRKRRTQTAPLDRAATWFHVKVRGPKAWRQLDSHLWDFEAAYGPAIDKLRPDVIHANDFRMLGAGARAKMRGVMQGRKIALVWDAHEFLPGAKPWNDHPRWHVAQMAHEREFAAYADEVVTVSGELAELLVERHGLSRTPSVVLNCPTIATDDGSARPGVRELCGVGPETPILVYSGSPSRQRGLGTVIEALPALPGVHVALVVAVPESAPVVEVVERAQELGVADRLHLLPYVAPEHVVEYLSSADIGLIPIQHFPNHEIALITKFFEYSHARLPIVVSDVRAMSSQVMATGQGEVFVADDVADFTRATRAVLADPARYRSAYDDRVPLSDWTWERQAEILDEVYRTGLRSLNGPS